MLANKSANLLEAIVWQNANKGVKKSKRSKKPEPYYPEFIKKAQAKQGVAKDTEAHSITDIKAILAKPRK